MPTTYGPRANRCPHSVLEPKTVPGLGIELHCKSCGEIVAVNLKLTSELDYISGKVRELTEAEREDLA